MSDPFDPPVSRSALARAFLRVGTVGFGGGPAIILFIRRLIVTEKKWLTEADFIEAMALAQSLPGTIAGNLAAYVGLRLGGTSGAILALAGFVFPSMVLMLGLAVGYAHLRAIPNIAELLHGMSAALVGLIVVAAFEMGRATISSKRQWGVAAVAFGAVAFFEATVLEVFLAAGAFGLLPTERRASRKKKKIPPTSRPHHLHAVPLLLVASWFAKFGVLAVLCAVLFRIGLVTFGGGFVMLPMIEAEVVNHHHWLTHQEFVDAATFGQITPGPVLITATFIGYRVAGLVGGIVATTAIFLPSLVLTIIIGRSIERFRENRFLQSFLDGTRPAVVGLLFAAAVSLGRLGIHSPAALVVAAAAAVVLFRFRVNPLWVLVVAGVLNVLGHPWITI